MKGPTTPQRKTSAVWAVSPSLAATKEIDFSFFSCGYLDVSVRRVSHARLWIQRASVRESRDQHSFDSSPELFAVFHALQSLLTPRHPPCALSSLATMIQSSPESSQNPPAFRPPGYEPTPNRSMPPWPPLDLAPEQRSWRAFGPGKCGGRGLDQCGQATKGAWGMSWH